MSTGRLEAFSSLGRPITNVTYGHDPPMAERYNDHGYDQTRAQRNADLNDSEKLSAMGRSENSSTSAYDDEGNRQDTGPNFEGKVEK